MTSPKPGRLTCRCPTRPHTKTSRHWPHTSAWAMRPCTTSTERAPNGSELRVKIAGDKPLILLGVAIAGRTLNKSEINTLSCVNKPGKAGSTWQRMNYGWASQDVEHYARRVRCGLWACAHNPPDKVLTKMLVEDTEALTKARTAQPDAHQN